METIAAARRNTVIQAGIGLRLIAIVARLEPVTHLTITAASNGASVETRVRLQLVAIITGLITSDT